MMILYWNVRDLNKAGMISVIRDFTRKYKCDVICLLEHKLKQDIHQTLSCYWGGMETTDNLSSDLAGRILVLWNPLTMILTKSAQTNQLIQFDAFSPITNS